MQTIIRAQCIDQTLRLTHTPKIASGGVNDVTIDFTFCSLWDTFPDKCVVFRRQEGAPIHMLMQGNQCVIPREALQDPGQLFVSVFAVNDGVTRTTEEVQIRVLRGAITEGTVPTDPTPTLYERLLEILDVQTMDIDGAMSEESTNPLQNCIITLAFKRISEQFATMSERVDTLRQQATEQLQEISGKIPIVDADLDEESENAIQNKVVAEVVNMVVLILEGMQEDIDTIRQLPAVTTADNGKLLQVVDGAWAAAAIANAEEVSF